MSRFALLAIVYILALAAVCLIAIGGVTRADTGPTAPAYVLDELGCAWAAATWADPGPDGRHPIVLDLAHSAPDCVALYAEGAETGQ